MDQGLVQVWGLLLAQELAMGLGLDQGLNQGWNEALDLEWDQGLGPG